MASVNVSSLLFGIFVLLYIQEIQGQDGEVVLEMTPENATEVETSSVHFRCSLTSVEIERQKQIYILEITSSKHKSPLAFCKPGSSAKAKIPSVGIGKQNITSRFVNVSGAVGTGSGNYIDVTLVEPSMEDTADYSCEMYYLDHKGRNRNAKSTKTLTVSEWPVVKRLTDRLARLEGLVLDQAKHNKDIETGEVYFSATFNSSKSGPIRPKTGDVLTFPIVLASKGEDFDGNDGTFIAPRNGLYKFELTLDATNNVSPTPDPMVVDIQVNGHAVTKLNARDQTQTTVTALAKLVVGDEVKATVAKSDGNIALTGQSQSWFTGILINADD